MNQLDAAKAEVARLESQAELAQVYEDASEAVRNDPSPENWAAHDAAAVALVNHRASYRATGGPSVGGDAVVSGVGE